jgi:hypothetical protein
VYLVRQAQKDLSSQKRCLQLMTAPQADVEGGLFAQLTNTVPIAE